MRAYIEDGELHLMTREPTHLLSGGQIEGEEIVFDEAATNAIREPFRQEFIKADTFLRLLFDMEEE